MVLLDFRELQEYYSLREQNVPSQMSTKRHKTSKRGFSIHTSLLCLILSGSILTLFGILYVDNIPWNLGTLAIDRLAINLGFNTSVQHAIIIDAGSTGSRIHAFTFHESYFGSQLILDKELFKYNKVGLSAFADNPAEGVKSIQGLLEEAKHEIPKHHWTNTSLLLRATAGLRLLQPEKAEILLQNIRNLFQSTPFITNTESVEIMNGTDEGIFSWFTVNFLLSTLNGNPTRTVAALDLGGASIQVTFAAQAPSSLRHQERIHQAMSPKGKIPVYTHSFLGAGLKVAVRNILQNGQVKSKNITSECVNHIIKGAKFKYAGEILFVSGPLDNYLIKEQATHTYFKEKVGMPIVDWKKCTDIVRKFVRKNFEPPPELTNKVIFAFSYFFVRAAEAGLIDTTEGGSITLKDLKQAAQEACDEPNTEQPFACVELSFIWILLEDGLGLRLETQINLFKKINGHEISWALGAAYDLLRRKKN